MAWHRILPRSVRQLGREILELMRLHAPVVPLDPFYPQWIANRMRQRAAFFRGPPIHDQPAIDVLTLVLDTQPAILRRTALSVRAQDYPARRWIIWDNGSTRPGTLAVLAELEQDPRIEVHRSPRNLGITLGHQQALSYCQGEYVALLDHDDELYPDALRIVAEHVVASDRPALLYSDEDKLDARGQPYCPFFKPDWSPALLQSTPYVCHLTVLRRDLVEDLGLFSDASVEGTQDWDLALRVHDAGYNGVHVPEVIYSWRMTSGSTSRKLQGKSFVLEAQRRCLLASLERRGLAGQYAVEPSPVYPFHDGHWHLRRLDTQLPSIQVLEGNSLVQALKHVRDDVEYLAWRPPHVVKIASDWLLEEISQLELNPDAALVGGRLLTDQNLVVAGGAIRGRSGLAITPDQGRDAADLGYFGLTITPRNVSVLADVPWVARRDVLDSGTLKTCPTLDDLCACLIASGWRIIANPHVLGWTHRVAEGARLPTGAIGSLATSATDDPYYSPCASLNPLKLYRPDRGQPPRFRAVSDALPVGRPSS